VSPWFVRSEDTGSRCCEHAVPRFVFLAPSCPLSLKPLRVPEPYSHHISHDSYAGIETGNEISRMKYLPDIAITSASDIFFEERLNQSMQSMATLDDVPREFLGGLLGRLLSSG